MNDATAPVLEVKGLTIALPPGGERATAVQNVSFSVGRGEIVCLVGESGSGKSVIAHSVMGLLPQALPVRSGQIVLQGEDITHAPAFRLRELRATRMSMIFQEPMTALNPVMTCGDQIDEVLREHTQLSAAQRRDKVLAIVREVLLPEPERMVASYPHQLSGGQRQRIMIAMALVLEPVLLIADEPTTALDVTTQAQILKLVLQLQARHGTGVLFITHDFGVVAELAHRVAVLRLGDLVEVGAKHEVLQQPRHDYTRMLIGAVPTLKTQQRAVNASAPLVLRTKRLNKTYFGGGWFGKRRSVHAAHDVDLEIRRGQTLGIVGESGSGKSTVARCIVRLVDPTGGEVLLGNDDIAMMPSHRLRPLRKRVQIVFQDPYRSLNPRRTIGEALIEGPVNYGLSRSQALDRAQEAAGHGAHGRRRDGALSAPVLRRPAPAAVHRASTDDGTRAADRRRGGVGARRVGAGAGAEVARRDPRTPEPRDAVHHARPARGLAGVRPTRGDVAGQGGGVRAGAPGVRCAAARVHPRAVRRCAGARLRVRGRDRAA